MRLASRSCQVGVEEFCNVTPDPEFFRPANRGFGQLTAFSEFLVSFVDLIQYLWMYGRRDYGPGCFEQNVLHYRQFTLA